MKRVPERRLSQRVPAGWTETVINLLLVDFRGWTARVASVTSVMAITASLSSKKAHAGLAAGRRPGTEVSFDQDQGLPRGRERTAREAFRTWWPAPNVRFHDTGVKRCHHPSSPIPPLSSEAIELIAGTAGCDRLHRELSSPPQNASRREQVLEPGTRDCCRFTASRPLEPLDHLDDRGVTAEGRVCARLSRDLPVAGSPAVRAAGCRSDRLYPGRLTRPRIETGLLPNGRGAPIRMAGPVRQVCEQAPGTYGPCALRSTAVSLSR
jgi:hypothetical protein